MADSTHYSLGPAAVAAAALISCLLCACPYHLVTEKSAELPAGVKALSVPLCVNRTIEAGLEDVFTQELIRRLSSDGRVAVVAPGRGEGELRCVINDLTIRPVSYTKEGRVAEESATVVAECRLAVVGAEGSAWRSGELTSSEDYPVGDDYLMNEDAKARALLEVARDFSESIRSMLLDSF